ncbi:MAG: hypothetical protein BGP13_13670 [Sphingobacteriales bacterium 40-81]|nr:MAG: hypothetical protein BGP13_13670 [Sphingobacteriales bacterium 40-81]
MSLNVHYYFSGRIIYESKLYGEHARLLTITVQRVVKNVHIIVEQLFFQPVSLGIKSNYG